MLAVNQNMRVLHSVDYFLRTTENWILPQITKVPDVESAVFCRERINPSGFDARKCFVQGFAGRGTIPLISRVYRGTMRRLMVAKAVDWARLSYWCPSVINAHFGTRGFSSLWLKKALGVPLITTFYGYDAWAMPAAQPEWMQRYAELFREGDVFLVEGPALARRLEDIGCPTEKIRIRPLGVDLSSLTFRQRTFDGALKIVMVGRFVEKKGLVDGLKACALAVASGVDLRISIVGDSTGEAAGESIKAELHATAARPELSGRVQFSGFLPHEETCRHLMDQDIMLCPSKHATSGDAEGGLPVVLTEAMALGLLCIGSQHCDIPEAIVDRKTGLLFESGNVEQLADVLRYVSRHRAQMVDLTVFGRTLIEQKYDLSHQLTILADIYRRCSERMPVS